MHVQILQENNFVEKVWPANLSLFIYVSTHYWYIMCSCLGWCKGNA